MTMPVPCDSCGSFTTPAELIDGKWCSEACVRWRRRTKDEQKENGIDNWIDKQDRIFKKSNPWEYRCVKMLVLLEYQFQCAWAWLRDDSYWHDPGGPDESLRGWRTGRIVEIEDCYKCDYVHGKGECDG